MQGTESSLSASLGGGEEGIRNATDRHRQVFDSKLFDDNVLSLDEVEADADTHDEEAAHEEEGHGDHGHEHNLWEIPKTTRARVFWGLSLPLMVAFTYTWRRKDKYKSQCIGTFLSIVWMALLVDHMVEAAVEGFHNVYIDMGPLGLTFVAAGTSFPDFWRHACR